MKIKPLKQKDEISCGPTSIEMVLRYFGMDQTFEEIAKVSQYKKKIGLSNKDLVTTLANFGLKTKEITNATWGTLKKISENKNNIVIVSWMKNGYIGHFSVVQQVTENKIIIADPQDGKNETMEKIVFMRLWMDYDEMWYPKKNTDIQLRWMCVVSKNTR